MENYLTEIRMVRERIIQAEIARWRLNQRAERMPDQAFNQLWLDSDAQLKGAIDQLVKLAGEPLNQGLIDQIIDEVNDQAAIKMVTWYESLGEEPIDSEAISMYIEMDLRDRLENDYQLTDRD